MPHENADEAAVVDGVEVYGVNSLSEAIGFLCGELPLDSRTVDLEALFKVAGRYDIDFVDVRGQEHVKRTLLVAVAGRHNVLMIGPPGSGKTMLAKRLPTIVPAMTLQESLETTRIYSASGRVPKGASLMATRPVEWIFAWTFNALVPHAKLMRSIELYQTQVLPRVLGK